MNKKERRIKKTQILKTKESLKSDLNKNNNDKLTYLFIYFITF